MKKRIVCVLLTLIMLVSLVPMGASAASHSTSAAAITVLKQMTTFKNKCYLFNKTSGEFRTGYGTVCNEKGHDVTIGGSVTAKHKFHGITEAQADEALREALKELDKKINNFASSNGLSLTQNEHDALVVFTYGAGDSWMNGTGVLKNVIINGAEANELLNAMNLWTNNADIGRRKVEVNMYMNGIYSNTIPSNYCEVTYNANGGFIAQGSPYTMYYDASKTVSHITAPTHDSQRFLGWYTEKNAGTWIPVLTKDQNGETLYAHYMTPDGAEKAISYDLDVSYISPKTVYKNNLKDASTSKRKLIEGKTTVKVVAEKMDANGNHWCKLESNAWVKVGTTSTGYVGNSSNSIRWTVTVTNSYVNRRVNANASSAQNGKYYQGDELGIIREDDGWLQVGQVQADGSVVAVGWVSSIYTNWATVQDGTAAAESTNVVATAIVTYNGYLNIRQEPGTDGKIVGALAQKDTVEIYEIRTVNGHRWGRTRSGWICLTYTSLTTLENASISDAGVKLYTFTGVVKNGNMTTRVAAGSKTNVAQYEDADGKLWELVIEKDKAVTVNNLVVINGETWAKATWKNDEWKYDSKKKKVETTVTRSGWVTLSAVQSRAANGYVELDPIKYNVTAETINVRENAGDANTLKFTLNKGTQVEVNEIVLLGENIWGKITVKNVDVKGKTGVESDTFGTSTGWINLASKYVSRNDVPVVEEEDHNTGKIATVINTDSLRVRKTGATYGQQIGTLAGGTTVAVWESNAKGWYKVDSNQNGAYDENGDGWVFGDYLDVREGTVGGTSTVTDAAGNQYTTDGTGKGIVANTYSGVNVRQGAGTGYAAVGKLLPGTAVDILETSGNGKWGRTAQGWVCMDYITMISYNEVADNSSKVPAGGIEVDSFADAERTSTTAVYTGKIAATSTVFAEPDLNAAAVRTASVGENITIHELSAVTKTIEDKTVNGDTTTVTSKKTTTYWARINDGWVNLTEGVECITLDALDEKVHTLTGSDTLNVRQGPSTSTDSLMKLKRGDQVVVTELILENDKVWGRIETAEKGAGYVRLDYMSEGALYEKEVVTTPSAPTVTPPTLGVGSNTGGFVTNTSGYRYTGKVIRTNTLNVRSTPSDTASKTTTLSSGDALVIYETTTANGMAWGRCDAGWVYLYYVDLTPTVSGAVDARVVYNDNTVIYTDMNCSGTTGSTYAKMAVIDIYEIVGKMARTDQGWVNTDNLL